jgi:hypothetical protein
MRFVRLVAAAAGPALAGLALGCGSISDSVTSPSRWLADSSEAIADSSQAIADSSNAASDSVSGSSSPDDDDDSAESSYHDDVRVATRQLADAPPDELLREVSRVAERHGISQWTVRASTWRALGAGLGEAGLSRAQAETRSEELGADAAGRALLLEGHAAAL